MDGGGTSKIPASFSPLTDRDRLSILVADDDPAVANSLAQILNQKGFRARPVYSGEAAVKAAAETEPDFLVSDIYMFGLSGIDAAALIRERAPGCRVILFSGNPFAEDLMAVRSRMTGGFEFLVKPFHPEVLLRRLRETC